MNNNVICFIAQFPPPIHGLSKAVDIVYQSDIKDEFLFKKIDLVNEKNIFKIFRNIKNSNANLYYFTISQTKGGNIRDLLILGYLRRHKKKCLVHLHGGYYRQLIDKDVCKLQRKINYKEIGNVSGAIVLGPSLKYNFEGLLPNEKIFTVPNCASNSLLLDQKQLESKIELSKLKKIKHILFLSNFIKSKGYYTVLKMAVFEKKRVDNGYEQSFHFDFAGKFFEEKDKLDFESFIENNGITDYVTYHGIVDGKTKADLLHKSDIFMLLTSYFKEGQPISILEAMSSGCVVISTKWAGISDIITDGINGYLFDPKDIEIEKLYETAKNIDFETVLTNARNSIIKEYSQKKYIENMRNIFIRQVRDK